MGGQATAVLLLRNVRTRTRLVEVGAVAGLAYLAMTVATGLYCRPDLAADRSATPAAALAWGTAGRLPGERPAAAGRALLRHRHRRQPAGAGRRLASAVAGAGPPGPGHLHAQHDRGDAGGAAAEAIGANPLLARVGSYFHDIGKMLKPHYFIENQTGENRHDALEPALSTLIIIGHVKDGVALAEQYRLPRPIIDFIQQHHGTTLVEYFYREACDCRRPGNDQRRRPAAPAGADVPLSRPQAADPRERHRHAGRRRGELQPGPDATRRRAACASWSTTC